MAIAYGAQNVMKDKNDFVLAGGMEAPVTPYALLCCNTSGMLTKHNDSPASAYKPFDKNLKPYSYQKIQNTIEYFERFEEYRKEHLDVQSN